MSRCAKSETGRVTPTGLRTAYEDLLFLVGTTTAHDKMGRAAGNVGETGGPYRAIEIAAGDLGESVGLHCTNK
jgi:hypothetical protein